MSAYILGRVAVAKLSRDASSTNITTAAYSQLIAATTSPLSFLDVYNNTGKILQLATGGAGSEVDLPFYIYPGITSQLIPIDHLIKRGVRLSVKAVDANATTGYLLLNMFA